MKTTSDVCGLKHAKWLDNGIRRLLQNPRRLFGEYVKPGSVAFDVGCGPGAFTQTLAEMVGPGGTVVAVDVQEAMLSMARRKLTTAGLADRVVFHHCGTEGIGLDRKADFVLTFYMVHESPDPMHLADEVANLLTPGGYWYLAEPKLHVTRTDYQAVIERGIANGLKVVAQKGVFSRIAVFQK